MDKELKGVYDSNRVQGLKFTKGKHLHIHVFDKSMQR